MGLTISGCVCPALCFLGHDRVSLLLGSSCYRDNAPHTLQVLPGGIALEMAAVLVNVVRCELASLPEMKMLFPLWRPSFVAVMQALTHSSKYLTHYTSPEYDGSILLVYSMVEFMNPVFAIEEFQLQEQPT